MSVLVTGGAGFIGSHLIEILLARDPDASVVCLDDFNANYDPALKRANAARFAGDRRVTLVEGSFCDAAAMQRLFAEREIRQVLHLGAYAGVRASVTQPAIFTATNVDGTLSLLEAARVHPVERFVFVSSWTVYGDAARVPFQEDAPLGIPLSPYGVTKRAGELLCFAYMKLHGVPVVCLRPFSVYGRRIRPDLAMWIFADAILRGRSIPLLGDGSYRRDFTHVSDVCEGLLAALNAPNAPGEAINLGHDEPIPVGDLVSLLEDALGRKAVIEMRPASPADLPETRADLTKARRLLDYQPRMALVDGVRDFAAWFRELRAT
ncbi:MAG: NAD-dependent epimerase/dehydratase family protein [Pirellulales bacterium]